MTSQAITHSATLIHMTAGKETYVPEGPLEAGHTALLHPADSYAGTVPCSMSPGIPGSPACRPEESPEPASLQEKPLSFSPVPGLPHIVVASAPDAAYADESGQRSIEEQVTAYMRTWPSVTAAITIEHTGDRDSDVLVKSRPGAVLASTLEGVYEVVKRLSSSASIKEAAQRYPSMSHVIKMILTPFRVRSRSRASSIRKPLQKTLSNITVKRTRSSKKTSPSSLTGENRSRPLRQSITRT